VSTTAGDRGNVPHDSAVRIARVVTGA